VDRIEFLEILEFVDWLVTFLLVPRRPPGRKGNQCGMIDCAFGIRVILLVRVVVSFPISS
jgi:hypothetical protein